MSNNFKNDFQRWLVILYAVLFVGGVTYLGVFCVRKTDLYNKLQYAYTTSVQMLDSTAIAEHYQIHHLDIEKDSCILDDCCMKHNTKKHDLEDSEERRRAAEKLILADNTSFWIALVSAWIAFISLILTFVTLRIQTQTENNTAKMTKDLQYKILVDLVRHLYRNYEVIASMYMCMENQKDATDKYTHYPSEEHFTKLQIPLTNIHPEAFVKEDGITITKVNELYLKMRNYNCEILAVWRHLSNPNMAMTTKRSDFDVLFSQTAGLTADIYGVIGEIFEKKKKSSFIEDCHECIKRDTESELKLKLADIDEANDEMNGKKLSEYCLLTPGVEFCNQFNKLRKFASTYSGIFFNPQQENEESEKSNKTDCSFCLLEQSIFKCCCHHLDKKIKNSDVIFEKMDCFFCLLKKSIFKRCYYHHPGKKIRLIKLADKTNPTVAFP